MIRASLDAVRARVNAACLRAGRSPHAVTLIGVTKYSDATAVNEAVAAGLLNIAENRVQAAQEKFPQIKAQGVSLVRHLIGHLQTNKVRDALLLFDVIQSVDSPKLVDEIEKRAAAIGKVQDILVQVDIAREEQKFWLAEEDIDALLARLENCPHIRTRGLMAMAPLTEDREIIRGVFRRLRENFIRVAARHAGSQRVVLEHLSMGMSGDYEIAIEEGSTMVRIGSAIFNSGQTGGL